MTREQVLEAALLRIADDLDHTNGHPNSWVVLDAVRVARRALRAPTGPVRVTVVPSRAADALDSILAEERAKIAALAGVLREVIDSVPATTNESVVALERARDVLARIG